MLKIPTCEMLRQDIISAGYQGNREKKQQAIPFEN